MNASDVAGNPAGVESTMAELVHLVADDVEPFDAVHPETLALYRKLSRRSFASAVTKSSPRGLMIEFGARVLSGKQSGKVRR